MGGEALLKTPLHAWHHTHGGRLVEFGGWSMPVQYSTITDEHRAVRERAGLFDISHMGRLDFEGADVAPWLDLATTNRVARLEPGKIQYSLMVDEHGGVIDDILVYRLPTGTYSVVCNASNRLAVVAQFRKLGSAFDAKLIDQTPTTAMIAVQGPAALAIAQRHLDTPLTDLAYYGCATGTMLGADVLISRTGYTGEDGFELILPEAKAEAAWDALMDAGRVFGLQPCGLGSRDTLRFEAAMPLYGHEMDLTVHPYAAGLGWAVKLDKGNFIGRDALRRHKAAPGRSRVGLALGGKRIARQGHPVRLGADPESPVVGVVTSGTFAPTLNQSLAMALVRSDLAALDTELVVDIRGNLETARVVPLPFYRRAGKPA